MQVYFSPQMSDTKTIIKINGNKVQIDNKLYDFTDLVNGSLISFTQDILSAKRVDGELYIEILRKVDNTATQDDLYPVWQSVEGNDVLDDDLIIMDLDWYSDEQKAIDDAIPKPPTEKEILEQQVSANMDYLLDIDFRLILAELGMF